MRVKSLHIYPVKSTQGIDLQTVEIRPRGLAGDRRFMLVGADGKFVTQRENPKLAQLQTQLKDGALVLSYPGHAPLTVQISTFSGRKTVTVWRSAVVAAVSQAEVGTILSGWLDQHVSLVYMDAQSIRIANPDWTDQPSPVSFADGYPVLITNTASLTALNALILSGGGEAVPMTRFRPNIVIDSGVPWGEDHWKTLRIDDVILDIVKPCVRCIISTLDQTTGEKQGREPLRALKSLRTSIDPRNEGVIFGMNAVPRRCGKISVARSVVTLL